MMAWPRLSAVFRANLLGLALGLSAVLLGLTPELALLEESVGLKLLFALRGPRTPPAQVATLAIDRNSATVLRTPDDPALWPRGLHAEALLRLKAAGAAVVVFDIFFGEPRDAQDAALVQALSEAGNAFLAAMLRLKHVQGLAYMEVLEPPVPALAEAALGHAPFLLAQGVEAKRFLPWHGEHDEHPTLPLLALRRYLDGIPPNDADSVRLQAIAGMDRILVQRGPRTFDHYGPAGTIPRLSYARLLSAAIDELPDLRGKIVVLGYAENFQSEESLLFSPYSTVSTMELTATALANLLENRTVRLLFDAWTQAVWLLALGLILGAMARRARMVRYASFIVLGAAIYLGVAVALFGLWGACLPLVLPLFWLAPLALLGRLVANYRRRAREHSQIHAAIRRFIPVDVASRLIHPEGQLDWDGRLCYGICLASDAGQYTALAERTEPMALGALMNAYYARLFPLVTGHGGQVSDVVGDAMMALWLGDECDVELHRRALRAALMMQEAVADFERERGVHLPLRIGLHCGPMRVGFVGAIEHGEYRAVGDTVNTAARLEGLNKLLGTRVLASEWLLAGCGNYPSRALGSFLLAGKSRPVPVHEVLWPDGEFDKPARLSACARFGAALALFQEERWLDAWEAFEALAGEAPEDGPTRFYRDAAWARLQQPESEPTEAVIRMEKPIVARRYKEN